MLPRRVETGLFLRADYVTAKHTHTHGSRSLSIECVLASGHLSTLLFSLPTPLYSALGITTVGGTVLDARKTGMRKRHDTSS